MLVSEVVICRREKRFKRTTVGLVVVTLAPLFLNCRSLIVEVRLINRQRAHAVRFEEQTEIQLVCGQRLEIHRAVGRRVAVHPATVVFNNDGLTKRRPHALGDDARDRVGWSARSSPHDHSDRP